MTTRGIFILETVRTRQREGEWVPLDDVYGKDSLQEVGYIVGGQNSSNQSTSNYQTINYSTETKGNISPLSIAKIGVFGTASPSAGYTYGGMANPSTHYSSIDKLTLSTQTHAALPSANMTAAYSKGGSCGSSTIGYLCGGIGPSEPNGYTRLEKLTYSTETLERIPGANMPGYPSGAWNNSASGDGDTAGYWVGGATQSGSRINKFTYSSDAWGTLPNLPGLPNLNRNQKAGQASSDTGFYLVGGSNPYSSRVQKVTFASGTNSIVTNSTVPTNNGRMRLTGTGSHSRGYFAGGTETSIVERMQFSTNSMTRLPALDLSQGVQDLGSLSSVADNKALPKPTQTFTGKVASFDFGYVTGGEQNEPYPGSGNTRTFKINYSTDTSARTPSADQNIATRYQFAAGNSSTGYIAGGQSGSTPGDGSESMDKFIYSTDTRSSNPNWGNRRFDSFAMTDGPQTAFYGLGGKGQPGSSFKDNGYKMDYATESPTTLPSNANLSIGRRAGASYANNAHGYMAGGGQYPGTARSKVDKIHFSSETTSQVPSANLPTILNNNYGTSEASAGYSYGGIDNGSTWYSSVFKTTFATDTSSNNPSSLPAINAKITTVGNPTNAYLVGGWSSNPTPSYHRSDIYKYTYSTETFSQLPNLASVMVSGAGMSASDDNMPFQTPPVETPTNPEFLEYPTGATAHGYYTSGNGPSAPGYSNTERLDFSSETYTTMPGMVMTGLPGLPGSASKFTDGSSNRSATHGYMMGGQFQGNYYSTIYKSTYSSSTTSRSPSNMISARYHNISSGSVTHGYTIGGNAPSGRSSVEKLNYSNDTSSNVGNLTNNRQRGGAASSPTALYASMSYYRTGFAKVTFSNDDVQEYVPSIGNVPNPGSSPSNYWGYAQIAGTGNKTQGYFGSGVWASPGSQNTLLFKVTYATETLSPAPNLNANSYKVNTGDNEKGYFMGSNNPNPGTQKLVFSTETMSTVPAGAPTNRSNGFGYGPRDQGITEVGTPNVV